MRPDLNGRGLGLEFVRLGLDFVHEQFPGRLVILDVAEFNVRARTVYERSGFRVTGRKVRQFSGRADVPFVDMEEL
jgi:[ribosomal protein S18]-alanine N-acetyltransferase